MVSEFGGFCGGGTGGEGEGEKSDDGIASATDIEDFAGAGGGVEGWRIWAEEEEAMFAESDEEVIGLPEKGEGATDGEEGEICGGGIDGFGGWEACAGEGFGAVRFDGGDAFPLERVMGMGIDGDDFAGAVSAFTDGGGEVLGEHSFGVILDDHGIDFGEEGVELSEGEGGVIWVEGKFFFAIDAHDVLLAGDDASFDDSLVAGVGLDGSGLDAFGGEEGEELIGVGADARDAHEMNMG